MSQTFVEICFDMPQQPVIVSAYGSIDKELIAELEQWMAYENGFYVEQYNKDYSYVWGVVLEGVGVSIYEQAESYWYVEPIPQTLD